MKITEFLACAECDSQEPIGKTRGGDETLFVCPDCGTVEGSTRSLLLNHETGEVRPVPTSMDIAIGSDRIDAKEGNQ